MSFPSPRRAWRTALLVPLGIVAACDIPSEAPILQQTWVVPTDSVSVGVSEILPAGIALNGAGTAFQVTTPTANVSTTLATLCGQPACQTGATVTAPVPAFTSPAGAVQADIALPAAATSVTVTGGQLSLVVTNNLGFDPLRPNAAGAPYGQLSLIITNGALTATTTFSGGTRALPTGQATTLTAPLPTGTYSGPITVAVELSVPAGDPAPLNGSNSLAVSASLTGVTVSQATVTVNNEAITTTPTDFDLSGVDFADQVESGGLDLTVINPFTATATLNMTITAPAQNGQGPVSIVKAVNVPNAPATALTVALTQAELRQLLGKTGVAIAVAGTATGAGAGNTVAVTPTQRLTVRTSVRVVLNVGA